MSAHVDSVTVAKRSGDNVVELQVFHVQVVVLFCLFSFSKRGWDERYDELQRHLPRKTNGSFCSFCVVA